jgi:hypothetical protein
LINRFFCLACDGLQGFLKLTYERVSEREEQRNTNTDHGYGVEQCDDEEHFRLQHRGKLRLARSAFEEAAAEQAHADAYAKGAKADQKCDSDSRERNNSFHQFLLGRIKSKRNI